MTFAWPQMFWLLLVPAALLAGEISRRRAARGNAHPNILQAEASSNEVSLVATRARPRRLRLWLCFGLILGVVALARPQWGRIDEPVFDQAREIIIAIDLSRSMLSQDVRPSRLARAKLLTQSLLEKLNGERVGLVSFAGTAFVQSPLSSDYEILREFLPALGPDFLPDGGTNYRALIDTSLAAFGNSAADRFLIILSDGEATDDDWRSRVGELKKKGIRVIGLGIGTSAGAMIPDGSGAFVKDERGAVVLSKLESSTLQELARVTGGAYRDASTWLDLASVLNATVETGQKGKFLEKNTVRLVERFQWPLALGVWCLLMSFCYEFPIRPRSRTLDLTPPDRRNTPSAPPATLALLLIGLLIGGLGRPTTARAAEEAPPNSAAALTKVVSRVAAKDEPTARDWAEFARETVSWGQHLTEDQQPVPDHPVRDALAAVELGSALNAKTADWPNLRESLEALLKNSDAQKQQQQQQQKNQQQQKEGQKKQDQQNQNQKSQDQKNQQSPPPDKSSEQKNASPKPPSDQDATPSEKKPGDSAFGDMKQPTPPPPPPSHDTQKVGGAPEKPAGDNTPTDPSLALPLQKLDQLRNQDSPAELFQLMDANNKKTTPKSKGKDW
ncbi:MAG: VWA domain-containing protein [Opitutaceae bacterium]